MTIRDRYEKAGGVARALALDIGSCLRGGFAKPAKLAVEAEYRPNRFRWQQVKRGAILATSK